jgi:DNA-directed RNA polymerase subunit RPC12/RpoP
LELDTYVCSNCGDLVEELDEFTGFCTACSPPRNKTESNAHEWLAKNANHIEFYMSLGNSVSVAIDRVYEDLRPVCLVCGRTISHASPGRVIFCRRTKICRRYARRYTYLYQDKGLSKSEALAQIVRELS